VEPKLFPDIKVGYRTVNKASVKGTALFEFLTRSRTDLKSHDSSKCKYPVSAFRDKKGVYFEGGGGEACYQNIGTLALPLGIQ
jgi:hypothetical protein